ncbi:hypothetical protein KOW79_013912 [Hemibagrus wyckioides]|uniref:Uncharacterized protein n=1 Tax=Hemibagrus wyckioides TaxID=337641 RepID=A0A9D3SFM7_9TELE|nr:hypothetical protein KOW79_013912 [Hemibagrus wyckioides]
MVCGMAWLAPLVFCLVAHALGSGGCSRTQVKISTEAMNLARIHDKQKLKKFWEQKIERHHQMTGNEEARMKQSALSKLRKEWIQRLLIRSQGMNEKKNTEELKKD